jgi:hypothetical protein
MEYLVALLFYLIKSSMQIKFSTSRLEELYHENPRTILRSKLDIHIVEDYIDAINFIQDSNSIKDI